MPWASSRLTVPGPVIQKSVSGLWFHSRYREQQALRREYLDEVKANFRAQMEHTSIKEPDGTIHKVIRKN